MLRFRCAERRAVFLLSSARNYLFSSLDFGLRQDDGYSGLDDISANAVSAVPEPSTWTMLLLGFAGIAGLRFWRPCRPHPSLKLGALTPPKDHREFRLIS
jgi:hypothetical protein